MRRWRVLKTQKPTAMDNKITLRKTVTDEKSLSLYLNNVHMWACNAVNLRQAYTMHYRNIKGLYDILVGSSGEKEAQVEHIILLKELIQAMEDLDKVGTDGKVYTATEFHKILKQTAKTIQYQPSRIILIGYGYMIFMLSGMGEIEEFMKMAL